MKKSATGRARVEIELPVELPTKGGTVIVSTSDISVGGCYIESDQAVRVGSRILFRLQLPSGRWVMMTGEVTHAHEDSGFGVRFVGVQAETEMALIHLLEYLRG